MYRQQCVEIGAIITGPDGLPYFVYDMNLKKWFLS
jgi:hypothetical protein